MGGSGKAVLGWRNAAVDSGAEGEAVEGFGLRAFCSPLFLGVSVRVWPGWVGRRASTGDCLRFGLENGKKKGGGGGVGPA